MRGELWLADMSIMLKPNMVNPDCIKSENEPNHEYLMLIYQSKWNANIGWMTCVCHDNSIEQLLRYWPASCNYENRDAKWLKGNETMKLPLQGEMTVDCWSIMYYYWETDSIQMTQTTDEGFTIHLTVYIIIYLRIKAIDEGPYHSPGCMSNYLPEDKSHRWRSIPFTWLFSM